MVVIELNLMKNSSREVKSEAGIRGEVTIKVFEARFDENGVNIGNGKLLETIQFHNKVVASTGGTGRNIILRQLSGDTTFPMEIDSAEIGTGTNAPADSDTALQTPVLTGIPIANTILTASTLTLTLYVTDVQLANGAYTELALRCGTKLFARALISPTLNKSSNQNISVDYTLSLTSS